MTHDERHHVDIAQLLCLVKNGFNVCIGYVDVKQEAKGSTSSWDTFNDVGAINWATALCIDGQQYGWDPY